MKRKKLFPSSRIFGMSIVILALCALFAVGVAYASGTSLSPTATWTYTGSLVTARAGQTATLLSDGKVLIAGGSGAGGAAQASAELFDPATGTWSATGSLNIARYQHTATRLPSGQVIVAGGACVSPCPSPGASAEMYDPATGTWTATGNLNAARNLYTATLLPSGKVLVAGGCGDVCTSTELYDPGTGAWTYSGSLSTARIRHAATLLSSGKVLIAGGFAAGTPNVLKSAELYNPAAGTWTTTGSMKTARVFHQATLLQNGQVLVTGGCPDNYCATILSSSELYNSTTGKWATTGRLVNVRGWGHTATLLPDGKVLVAAGCEANLCSTSDSSAELYNPGTGKWSLTGSLNEARYLHTATLLPDGTVLVAAGCGNPPCTRLASAELYIGP